MIKINERYSIGSDPMNIILFEHKVTTGSGKRPGREGVAGQEYQSVVGYFATSKGALDYMVKREIYGTGMKDYETIVARVEELHQDISRLKEQPLPRLQDIYVALPVITLIGVLVVLGIQVWSAAIAYVVFYISSE